MIYFSRRIHAVCPTYFSQDGDVVLLVGTMKGAFLLRSNRHAKKWDVGAPTRGSPVYAMALDQRRRAAVVGTAELRWGTTLLLVG